MADWILFFTGMARRMLAWLKKLMEPVCQGKYYWHCLHATVLPLKDCRGGGTTVRMVCCRCGHEKPITPCL